MSTYNPVSQAFIDGKALRHNRTTTDGEALYLHGNRIAWREPNGDISMTLAGWPTQLTRDRLNGLCELLYGTRPWHQKDGAQYHNDTCVSADQIITYHNIELTQLAAE